MDLPSVGLLTVRDLETGEHRLVDTSSVAVREGYSEQWQAAVERRRGLFYSLGLDTVELYTDRPYFPPLLGFFRRRQRRLAQGR